MFQGGGDLRRRNWVPLGSGRPLDAVVLSHAHLDHSGWLPRLVRDGYAGPVLCSPWTARVAPIVLRDAAHLQEEDAEHAARRGYSRHHPPQPLFTTADAEKAIALLTPVAYGQPYALADEATLTLRRAGHILGSSTVELRAGDASVGFTGDLGGRTIRCSPRPTSRRRWARCGRVDLRRPGPSAARPAHRWANRSAPPWPVGGVVLIPAFAVDRTPVLLLALRQLMRDGAIPPVPVYVDSPMALAALDVYRDAVAVGRRGDPGRPSRPARRPVRSRPAAPGAHCRGIDAAQPSGRTVHRHLRIRHGHRRSRRPPPRTPRYPILAT